jgi:hypothetical protein
MRRTTARTLLRTVFASLRDASSPLTVREIACRVAAATGLDVSTTAAMSQAVASLRAALARPDEGLVCEKHRQGAYDVAGDPLTKLG